MDRRNLPLAALRAFESAGRHLHMGHAGEELGVSHGAISHHVRALEEQLGVTLFDRANRKLRLTAAGRQLLERVSASIETLLDATQKLDPASMAGDLTFGCTQTIAASFALPIIDEFMNMYPETRVRLQEIQPRQRVIAADIDVAICYGEPDHDARPAAVLFTPDIYPVASPALFHNRRLPTRPAHLAEFTLLNNAENTWTWWFENAGVSRPDALRELDLFNTVLTVSAARSGIGIALCNALEIERELRDGALFRVLDRAVPESNSYFLLADEPARRTQRAQRFCDLIERRLAAAAA